MAKLTIADLKYIKPAVIYGWKVERWLNKRGEYSWYWDGDTTMPVKVGKLMEKLVSFSLMECVDIHGMPFYRRTEKAYSLQCKNCNGHGEHYDDDGYATDKCEVCGGLGMCLPKEDE